MKITNLLLTALILIMTGCSLKSADADLKPGDIKPVPFTKVHFTDQFWQPRIEANRKVSIPSAFHQCEINGRFDNFALAGGLIEGEHQGDFSFDDTDPYKVIEGASYSLAVQYDAELDAYLDSVIGLIAAAQEADGYLTTCVTNECTRLSGWWGSSRWEKMNSHELYNSGHLYEAAVAHYQATGKRSLLNVALKNADLVCEVFGLGEGQIKYPSGHPIIEMALVKLYEVTGQKKYLEQARYFVDEAGRLSNGRSPGIYSQDHEPVLEQKEIVGHAVRAGYFYAGVTDVAMLQNDAELLKASESLWDNMAGKKLYITGGIGSRAQGEGFGPDYELNNFNNYCETCASIANVYWNHRLFLATGEAKYADVMERTLYNGVLAGVSLSGDRFFYGNPLASAGGHERAPWFGCACCPGNVTRFMASVPGYAYATAGQRLYVNLYAQGQASVAMEGGTVELEQLTKYPWEGLVELTLKGDLNDALELCLRQPGWTGVRPVASDLYIYADNEHPEVRVSVNGENVKAQQRDGYLVLKRQWRSGDRVVLDMDMPVRRVQAHPKVAYNEGLLSMERGPVVYALEGVDQHRDYIFDLVIPRSAEITASFRGDLLNGVVVLKGNATWVERDPETGSLTEHPLPFKAVPYSTWNNRDNGQMVVWTPETKTQAIPRPQPTLASEARMVNGWGFNDQFEPGSSADINTPYHYWWLKVGSEEWIGYAFDEPQTISGVEVYWLAFDHYDVLYRAPESWKLFYKKGTEWLEVENSTDYGTLTDQYNQVLFTPVTTTELKLVAQLKRPATDKSGKGSADGEAQSGPQLVNTDRRGFSGGVIEWKVIPADEKEVAKL